MWTGFNSPPVGIMLLLTQRAKFEFYKNWRIWRSGCYLPKSDVSEWYYLMCLRAQARPKGKSKTWSVSSPPHPALWIILLCSVVIYYGQKQKAANKRISITELPDWAQDTWMQESCFTQAFATVHSPKSVLPSLRFQLAVESPQVHTYSERSIYLSDRLTNVF